MTDTFPRLRRLVEKLDRSTELLFAAKHGSREHKARSKEVLSLGSDIQKEAAKYEYLSKLRLEIVLNVVRSGRFTEFTRKKGN